MDDFSLSARIWTPRWGHTDEYTVRMNDKEMTVTQGMQSVRCSLDDNGVCKWDGENGYGHPLLRLFNNDSIYPPEVLPRALEWAWEDYRIGSTKEDLRSGLVELLEWVDSTSRAKPESQFWQGKF